MEKEIWKSIGVFKGVDLTGYYEVSNLGRVKRLARYDNIGRYVKEKILDRAPNSEGNVFFSLVINKTVVCGFVSQYVMNAFHPEHDPSKNRVRHIDGNKLNNRLDNLEWASQKDICSQGVFTEKQAQALKEKVTPIVQLDMNGNFVAEYRLRDDLRNANLNPASVTNAINKNKYSYKGYVWMYKPDYENATIKDIRAIINSINKRKEERKTANCKAVLQLDMDGNLIAEHKSLTQASKAVGCTKQAISLCLVNPYCHVSCKGYMWRYKK